MKKFVSLCKKTLLIVCGVVFVVFLAGVIAVSCVSHGDKYEFKLSMGGITEKVVYDFQGGNTIEMKMYLNGIDVTDEYFEGQDTRVGYFISGGILYTINQGTTERVGKINAYRIILDPSAEGAALVSGVKLVCPLTTGLRDFFISMIVISFVGGVGCVCITMLDKKGKIKYKNNAGEVSTANASAGQVSPSENVGAGSQAEQTDQTDQTK